MPAGKCCKHQAPSGLGMGAADQKAKRQDVRVLKEAVNCAVERENGLRGGKKGGAVTYFCKSHGPSKGCFKIDKDRAAWVQGREKMRRSADSACHQWGQHQKWARSWTATAEPACADRNAHDSPPETNPHATVSKSESECGLGAARLQHAANDEVQPGQLLVHRAEGLCALSSGSTSLGFSPLPLRACWITRHCVHEARNADEPSAAASTHPTLDPSECERSAASSIGDEAQCVQRPAREGLCVPSSAIQPGRLLATSSRRSVLGRLQGTMCTDRDAHNMRHEVDSLPTTATASPRATSDNSESECCLRAGRHQSAASMVTDKAQLWQR
ncbi:hypothetical protein KFL_013400020 [Klebsormidium nitens]|uniref:Uncharacterized protein n=1 Tax=Klebsormidium nitens TaxID=105231 RepID=A0A1Y1IR72_KLENI|nr:hypothetical protein KFL_013400020 [Klebsormidium nitens]|eukprot:GAQ93173.1 hypothetical protein KFL_013400020 [Klebsormidium nitens]